MPFFLCKYENIISDGAGSIDIRFAGETGPTNTKCKSADAVCCLHPEPRPLPEYVAELIAEPYYPSCGHRNPEGIGFAIEGFKVRQYYRKVSSASRSHVVNRSRHGQLYLFCYMTLETSCLVCGLYALQCTD